MKEKEHRKEVQKLWKIKLEQFIQAKKKEQETDKLKTINRSLED